MFGHSRDSWTRRDGAIIDSGTKFGGGVMIWHAMRREAKPTKNQQKKIAPRKTFAARGEKLLERAHDLQAWRELLRRFSTVSRHFLPIKGYLRCFEQSSQGASGGDVRLRRSTRGADSRWAENYFPA